MRKAQKEQICNFLELLKQAHKKIEKNLETSSLKPILTLLADIQDGAIVIGNLIEEAEGKGFITVSLLETYCEMLYQLHNTITECFSKKQIITSENALCRELNDLFQQVEYSVRNDIIIKKEVVFLPYKAAMWDSMESMWKAAEKDPNCDVYVIPIPYFNKKPDGSFGDMYYEGELYPKDVPITFYESFNLAEHRPDSIVIHNPYDASNLVTSVHPDFYSKKLKEYTEELVYVPYFILEEVSPDNEVAVEKIAHFCKLPAVLNADKVIVQSEQMKQVYVKVLTECVGEITKKYWEQKIWGLGSPKEDKLLSIRKEELYIPEEWKCIICKNDGTSKKVVFYNTGLSAFLQHSNRYLKKLKEVLRVFKKYKEDVVLLWRPHPLMQITMKSMHPEMEMLYVKIVQQYKNEKWGIYDDTPDLNRAIYLADAYYGDTSSVVQLCQKVGLPVMIQDVEVSLYNIRRI